MRFEGSITSWNDERGFGRIESDQGGEPVFVHIKAFQTRTGRPSVGMRVSFEIEVGPKGKRALNVQAIRKVKSTSRHEPEASAPWSVSALLAIPILAAVYYLTSRVWPVSPVWAAAYGVASFITFFAYAFDKTAAVRKTWRTSEGTLHMFGLLCGWPGAILAQQALRHKSSKSSFRAVFWLTVAANLCGFVVLNSPFARHLLGAR